jgi:hypothetical protein
MAFSSLLSDSDFNNSLIDHGAYQNGYHLVKHPHLKTWGLRNQAGQVAFWDHAGRPFDTLSAVDAWLLIRRQEATDMARIPTAAPTSARRRRAFDRAFVTGGAK